MSSDQPIKSFCIDFNWDLLGKPASPGLYAHAEPRAHLDWYRALGVNVIQTFAVSYNGYAWYRSHHAPVTPGLQTDFLNDLSRQSHDHGLRCFGYFCLGSNFVWQRQHPDQVHAQPWTNAPLTTAYLDYFCASLRDALHRTEMDGIFIDWFNPISYDEWLPCERGLYGEVMGEPFPAAGPPPADVVVEYDRRVLDRAWQRIRDTARAERPALIWVNVPFAQANDPVWNGHRLLREVDWVLNEGPDHAIAEWLTGQVGPQTRIIQNLVGWPAHDANAWRQLDPQRFGFYGFVQPDPATTLPAPGHAGIETLRAAYAEI